LHCMPFSFGGLSLSFIVGQWHLFSLSPPESIWTWLGLGMTRFELPLHPPFKLGSHPSTFCCRASSIRMAFHQHPTLPPLAITPADEVVFSFQNEVAFFLVVVSIRSSRLLACPVSPSHTHTHSHTLQKNLIALKDQRDKPSPFLSFFILHFSQMGWEVDSLVEVNTLFKENGGSLRGP